MKNDSERFCVTQQYVCFVFLSVCAKGTYYLYTEELPDALLEHNGVVRILDRSLPLTMRSFYPARSRRGLCANTASRRARHCCSLSGFIMFAVVVLCTRIGVVFSKSVSSNDSPLKANASPCLSVAPK